MLIPKSRTDRRSENVNSSPKSFGAPDCQPAPVFVSRLRTVARILFPTGTASLSRLPSVPPRSLASTTESTSSTGVILRRRSGSEAIPGRRHRSVAQSATIGRAVIHERPHRTTQAAPAKPETVWNTVLFVRTETSTLCDPAATRTWRLRSRRYPGHRPRSRFELFQACLSLNRLFSRLVMVSLRVQAPR